MSSLKEYVKDNLQKGYTKEQIKNFLVQHGYSQKDIDEAFGNNQVVQTDISQLQNYVQTYLRQGYSPEQLYNFLLNKGYKKSDLIQVFKTINNQYYNGQMPLEVIHKHDVSSGAVIKIGVALMIMFMIGTGFFFFMQNLNEPTLGKLLDVVAEVESEQVQAGGNLEFNVLVTNMGRPGNVDVYFNYILRTEYGRLVKKETDTKAFDTTLNFDKDIRMPSDLPTGTYELEILAVYDSQSAGDKFYFNVVNEEIPEPEVPKEENKPITPIEPIEPITPIEIEKPEVKHVKKDQTISDEKLFSMAIDSNDKSQSIGYCEAIELEYLHKECLNQIATMYDDEGVCQYLSEEDREDCYLGLIVSGRHELCSLVKEEVSLNICNTFEIAELGQQYINGTYEPPKTTTRVNVTENSSYADPCDFFSC